MLTSFRAAALLAALALGGCSSESGSAAGAPLMACDFENFAGWLTDSPAQGTLTRVKAHSGQYSVLVDAAHEFSLSYNNQLRTLAPARPSKLTVSGWVLVPSAQSNAKLVAEVKNPTGGPSLLWEGLDVAKTVKTFGEWQYVEQTFSLPPTIQPNSRLLVYLWRAESREPVYLDDLKIVPGQ